MLQKLLAGAAWALLAFIVFATISPIRDRPTVFSSPSPERIAAYLALGALLCLAYPRHIVLVCLVVLGSAVLLEIAQLFTPGRHGRLSDAMVKMTGGALGILVGRTILYFAQRTHWRKTGSH